MGGLARSTAGPCLALPGGRALGANTATWIGGVAVDLLRRTTTDTTARWLGQCLYSRGTSIHLPTDRQAVPGPRPQGSAAGGQCHPAASPFHPPSLFRGRFYFYFIICSSFPLLLLLRTYPAAPITGRPLLVSVRLFSSSSSLLSQAPCAAAADQILGTAVFVSD